MKNFIHVDEKWIYVQEVKQEMFELTKGMRGNNLDDKAQGS